MNSNFALLNNSKKTIAYINKQLINYPKSEVVLKQNIEHNMYEIIELIFLQYKWCWKNKSKIFKRFNY